MHAGTRTPSREKRMTNLEPHIRGLEKKKSNTRKNLSGLCIMMHANTGIKIKTM